ncbi:MAG: hypothetical protein J7M21_01885 [Planctomycetes bacterium]|nr:hypothetical protein [Planctomycetota bacterium]
MPKNEHSELAAGLFVVGGIVVGLGVVLWLGAADVLKARGQLLAFSTAMSDGALDVAEGADVTLGDGRIGRIMKIEAVPAADGNAGRCLYIARLERTDITVRTDAEAVVDAPPVGQAKVVLLSLGTSGPPADRDHPVKLSGGGLGKAMSKLNTLVDTLNATAGMLQAELDRKLPDSVLGKIHGIVADIQKAAKTIAAAVANVERQTRVEQGDSVMHLLHASVGNINTATASVAGQLDANRPAAIAAKLSRAADNIKRATDPNARGYLLNEIHGTVGRLDQIVRDAQPKVAATLSSAQATAGRLETYTRKDIGQILLKLRQANDRILKILNDFSVVSGQTRQMVALNRDNIDVTLDNLAQVSVDLKAAAKEIRRNPWRLLYRPDKKELDTQNVYDAARAFSNGAAELDRAVARLEAMKNLDPNDPLVRQTRRQLLEHLHESFRKFTRVENALWDEMQR